MFAIVCYVYKIATSVPKAYPYNAPFQLTSQVYGTLSQGSGSKNGPIPVLVYNNGPLVTEQNWEGVHFQPETLVKAKAGVAVLKFAFHSVGASGNAVTVTREGGPRGA